MVKVIKVEGMTCSHCVQRVKKALNTLDGIKDVEVNLASGEVRITSEREISCEEIKRAIEEWDYKVVDC